MELPKDSAHSIANTSKFDLSKCPNYDPAKSRFLVLNSKDKKLSTVSPFIIQKFLESQIGNPKNVRQLPSGDLLVETNSNKQTMSLLQSRKIDNISITVTPHNTLNISKGVITVQSLQYLPISEIIEGLSDQSVVDARHITIKRGKDIITTQHLILTFNSATLSTDIKVGYINCKVRPYVPNPLRCFKCQKFGHSTNHCRGKDRLITAVNLDIHFKLAPGLKNVRTVQNLTPPTPDSVKNGKRKNKSSASKLIKI
nr:uncharacterized protein LOC122270227 [Parasteatoda tepidariorum]